MAVQGRRFKPTDEDRVFVERSIMVGTKIGVISKCLNITDETLRKHFKYEITTARERLKNSAVQVMLESLEDGSLDAAKFVLGRAAGWTEKTAVDNTSSDGSMQPVTKIYFKGV